MICGLEAGGLSRTEIAREAKVSRMTVWRLAEGVAREPSYHTIERINGVAVRHRIAVPPLLQKMR